jgi:hypothetical protein
MSRSRGPPKGLLFSPDGPSGCRGESEFAFGWMGAAAIFPELSASGAKNSVLLDEIF